MNVEGSRTLAADAERLGVKRFVLASTCSNYGRMADPTTPIDEEGVLAPVSLYAEQKVEIEKVAARHEVRTLKPTCLRFATVYGVAPRMRFDLTVNEFTRDLWADRKLEVFGEKFWRPYVHVRDAGRAVVATVLDAPIETVAGKVFNVGRSGENYRKLDIVEEIRKLTDRGEVSFVNRDEDPRDYKVSFDKIRSVLGFETEMTVPTGIAELLEQLDEHGVRRSVRRPLPKHPLSWSRSSICASTREDLDAVAETLRSGWLTMGPRTQEFERRFAETIGARARGRRLQLHVGAAPRVSRRGHRPRRRGDRPVAARWWPPRLRCSTPARTPVFADIVSVAEPLIDPDHVEALITPRTKAVVAMHYGGYAAAVDRWRRSANERGLDADRGRRALAAGDAGRQGARHLGRLGRVQLLLEQGARRRRGRAARDRRRRGRGVRADPPRPRDDLGRPGIATRAAATITT